MKDDDEYEQEMINAAGNSGCFGLAFGVALTAVAAYFYWYFSLIESAPGVGIGQAPCCIAVAYNFFGKWVTVGLIAIPGLWLVFAAVRRLIGKTGSED